MEWIKFNTEDFNVKYASITTIYNQYLIWNYFKTDIKNAKQQGLGLVDQNLQNKGDRAQRPEWKLRTANQN